MDHWRRERYSKVSKALQRIERRNDKLVQRIDSPPSTGSRQHRRQVPIWADEVAKLQDMSDRLLDFRSRLFFFSNLDYREALEEWETEIETICIKAKDISRPPTPPSSRQNRCNQELMMPTREMYQQLLMQL